MPNGQCFWTSDAGPAGLFKLFLCILNMIGEYGDNTKKMHVAIEQLMGLLAEYDLLVLDGISYFKFYIIFF